jgi:cytidyltransferase-like protein
MTKVLVFGTFDELSVGHIAFLKRARRFGDELIVLVVEDEFVVKYKGKTPRWSLKMRMGAVRRLPFKPTVYQEDIRENWKSLKTIQPDVIVLSPQQAGWRHRLDLVLEEYRIPTRVQVLPGKQLEASVIKAGPASAARNPLAKKIGFPTQEEIRAKAEQICLERGGQPGHELNDWLQAEHDLMQLPVRKLAELPPPKPRKGTKGGGVGVSPACR